VATVGESNDQIRIGTRPDADYLDLLTAQWMEWMGYRH
jgi:hypothetical protein